VGTERRVAPETATAAALFSFPLLLSPPPGIAAGAKESR
jgi:hypothetical protein